MKDENTYTIKNLTDTFQKHADMAELTPNDYGETFNIARALYVICKEIEILKENQKLPVPRGVRRNRK